MKRKLRKIAWLTLFFFVVNIAPVPYWTPWVPAELYMHIGGKVTDAETGEAVSDLEIFAINIDRNNEGVTFSGKTSKDGRYSICCAPPGTYQLIIDQRTPYMREPAHKVVTVVRGKNVVHADLAVQKGSRVSGHVLGSDGTLPKAEALVVALLETSAGSLVHCKFNS